MLKQSKERGDSPDSDMSESSSNRQVATEVVDGVTRSVPGNALNLESGFVERPIGVKNRPLIVLRSVRVEEILREERELSSVPGVRRVHRAKDDTAESDPEGRIRTVSTRKRRRRIRDRDSPNVLRDLSRKGGE